MPKSLAMSSDGVDFDTFMKAIVKVPREKRETAMQNEKKTSKPRRRKTSLPK